MFLWIGSDDIDLRVGDAGRLKAGQLFRSRRAKVPES